MFEISLCISTQYKEFFIVLCGVVDNLFWLRANLRTFCDTLCHLFCGQLAGVSTCESERLIEVVDALGIFPGGAALPATNDDMIKRFFKSQLDPQRALSKEEAADRIAGSIS